MSVTGRREGRRDRANVLDIVKSAAHLDGELFAGIDNHRRRGVGIYREEVLRRIRFHVPLPKHCKRPGTDSSTSLGSEAILSMSGWIKK